MERVHGDLETIMHAPEVDAVYIALPNALHHEAVLEAARGKKHILCEEAGAGVSQAGFWEGEALDRARSDTVTRPVPKGGSQRGTQT